MKHSIYYKMFILFLGLIMLSIFLLLYLIYQNSVFDYEIMTLQKLQITNQIPMQEVYLLKINKKNGVVENRTLLWNDWANISKNREKANKKKKRVRLTDGREVDFPYDWDNKKMKDFIIETYGKEAVEKYKENNNE